MKTSILKTEPDARTGSAHAARAKLPPLVGAALVLIAAIVSIGRARYVSAGLMAVSAGCFLVAAAGPKGSGRGLRYAGFSLAGAGAILGLGNLGPG